MFNGGPIICLSKKQTCISTSTAESEYVTLGLACRNRSYVSAVCEELGMKQQLPTVLYEDNQSAISIATSDTNTVRTRHILVQFHYARDQVKRGVVRVVYCPTADMIADIFTKALDKIKFRLFRDMLMGGEPVSWSWRPLGIQG